MPATIAKRTTTYDETQFDMPRTALAKTVLWFPDRHIDKDCYAAFVTRVDDRSVDLMVVLPECVTMIVKTGVRHRNDPDGEQIDRNRMGVWDFPEDDVASTLVEALKHINVLRERVERVERLEKK